MEFISLLEFFAPFAIAALIVSTIIGIVLKYDLFDFSHLSPSSQVQIASAATFLPTIIMVLFFVGATLGWLIYGPEEMCFKREQTNHISSILSLFSLIFLGRILVGGANLLRIIVRERKMFYQLGKCFIGTVEGCRVIPTDEPQAFVIGILKPEIYLSKGLIENSSCNALKAAIAHEKAHLRQNAPRRRLIALITFLFHLPQVAEILSRRLTLAQELSADEEAAQAIGDRTALAEIIVNFARRRKTDFVSAFEFGGSDVEARVLNLLNTRRETKQLTIVLLAIAASVLFLLMILAAHQLHLIFESILQII